MARRSMLPEIQARRRVELALQKAGWQPDTPGRLPTAAGVAVKDLRVNGLILDFGLVVDDLLLGAVEVKARGLPREMVAQQVPRFFVYVTTGAETVVAEGLHPESVRAVSGFVSPAALRRRAFEPSLAEQLASIQAPSNARLQPAQQKVVAALLRCLAADEHRVLVQLPNGFGRLAIAADVTYRLMKHTSVRRVLVLVGGSALADQAAASFGQFPTGQGLNFADEFATRVVGSERVDLGTNVHVMTVQQLQSLISTDKAHDVPGLAPSRDAFDLIWADESHHAASGRWGELLGYFDAPVVGLTSSPTPEALRFYDGNLVAEVRAEEVLRTTTQHRPARATVDDVLRRADRYRDVAPTSEAVRRALDEGGDTLAWRDLSALIERAEPERTQAPAPFVLDFLSAYLAKREATHAVDPAVSTPALLASVIESGAAFRAVGFVPDQQTETLARALQSDSRLTWTRDDDALVPGAERSQSLGQPDLIISFPPVGLRGTGSYQVSGAEGDAVGVRREHGHEVVLRNAVELSDDGEGIFLVGDDFLWRTAEGQARVRAFGASAGRSASSLSAGPGSMRCSWAN
jgi:hypothetical protein